MFQLLKNTFLIRANDKLNSTTNIIGYNNQPLIIDTDFQKYHHSTQIGEIAYIPLSVSSEDYLYDNKLSVGDKIVFHHFVCQPDNEVYVNGEKLFKCDYFFIWAKINNNKFEPLEDIIFVEPIVEQENEIKTKGGLLLKNFLGKVKNIGVVYAASKSASEKGLVAGDKVFFTNDADYDIKIFGKDFYRMRSRNIIGIERNGRLVCTSDKMIVKEIVDKSSKKLLMLVNNREKIGKVINIGAEIKGISIGDIVCYFNGLASRLNYQEEEYSFLKSEEISYKILQHENYTITK